MSEPTTVSTAPGGQPDGADPIASLRERYLAAQLAGDRQEALRLIIDEGLGRGIEVADLHLRVIQEAQREIGRLWQLNRASVAQEHLATAISQLAVSHLYRHLRREASNGKLVIVACAPGELHELGARMAADFLEMDGFAVLFLGASVPAESLASLVRARRPDLVVLSAATSLSFPGLRRALQEVRDAGGESLPILVGGSAFAWSAECDIPAGVIRAGGDAQELVEAARAAVAA